MNRVPAFRSVLALVILLLVTLWAVPAYPWHGSGNITALAIAPRTDPETPTTLYAGTSDRGVFKSTDGGASWSATGLTNTYVLSLAIDPLAIDPQTPSTVYAGTQGSGVFKTADRGGSWSATSLTNGLVRALVIDSLTPTTLYTLIPDTGVLKSTDGGGTWNLVLRNEWFWGTTIFQDLAIDPHNPAILYASVYYATSEMEFGDVLKSTDGGATWYCTALCTNWWTGPIFLPFGDLAVAPQTSRTPSTVYAAGGSYYSTVFKSADEGASWIELPITQSSCCVYDLAIDPVTPTILYAGTPSGVYKSMDGGATWNAANSGLTDLASPNPDVGALAIDPATPTTLYAGTGVGVFKSTDGAGSWSPTGLIRHSPLSSLSLSPTSMAGGSTSTGTVTLLTAAPTGGVAVTLSSSNSAVAAVPASVTVPAGAASANFTVSTSAVTATTVVTISAAVDDAAKSSSLLVNPPPPATTLSSVSLSPTSVAAGNTSTGTVTLSAPAPAGGAVVTLSSGNTALATVPASVTVAAGATSANFTVSTSSVLPPTYVSISVAILASNGGATAYQYLQLTLPAAATLSSLSLEPASVSGGAAATGTVVLSAPAPAGGAAVALSSSNPAVVTVPATATVPAGATSANFTVSTSSSCTSSAVTISGTYGGVTRSAGLTVSLIADTVIIQQADYFASKHELRVAAKSSNSTATLEVYVTSSGELVGTLRNLGDGKYGGQLLWPVNPQNVKVVSSQCGSATSVVRSK